MQHKLNLLKRDITVNAISRCGKFRVTAVSAPGILKETIRRHKLNNDNDDQQQNSNNNKFKWDKQTAIPLLGQTICFSNLSASWLQHEERAKSSFSTIQNGTFIAQSLALGETVAFVRNRPIRVIEEKEKEGAKKPDSNNNEQQEPAYEYDEDLLHSNGVLKIERIMYQQTTPILSATKWLPSALEQDVIFNDELEDSNINNNLGPHVMNYFGRSDGVPTAAFFFCHYDENKIDEVYNGGVLIQAVAASAAEVEDPKNDFDEHDGSKNKIKLTAERELENYILDRCDVFSRLGSPAIDFEKEVVNYAPNYAEGEKEDISKVFLNQLHRRATQGLLLQDLLGLATNDWNGSAKVCAKARHLSQKDLEADSTVEWPASIVTTPELATLAEKCVESTLNDIKEKKKKHDDVVVEEEEENNKTKSADECKDKQEVASTKKPLKRVRIDVDSTKRTPIDFFCRCQRDKGFENFLKSMKTSETAIQFMKDNLVFDETVKEYKYECTSCGLEQGLTEEAVMKMFIE